MGKTCWETNEPTNKEFRVSLRKPLVGTPAYKNPGYVRTVPAFTIQSLQKNVQVQPPPKYSIFKPKPHKDSHFKRAYLRGEFPITIDFDTFGQHICWKVCLSLYYYPMSFICCLAWLSDLNLMDFQRCYGF